MSSTMTLVQTRTPTLRLIVIESSLLTHSLPASTLVDLIIQA